jgi:hypothetical protein
MISYRKIQQNKEAKRDNMSTQTITIKGRYFDAVTGALVTAPVKTKKSPEAKHAPKPSSTLMRAAVKKPSVQKIRVQASLADEHAVSNRVIAPKISASSVNPSRSERAKHTARSEKVSRFGTGEASRSFVKRTDTIPVQIAPDLPENTEPAVPEPQRTNEPGDMFVRAIANASHYVDLKEHRVKQRRTARRHAVSMATGFVALLVIAGFAAYINTPGLQIRIAGIEAGVSAMQPDFAKAGFAYDGVKASDGKRIIGLKANGSDYQLLERSTNWDGQTMIGAVSSVSANGTPNYTEVKVGKNTVYRFNDKQATWVKDGTWYHLSGKTAVSDAQLAALVQNS